MIAMDRRRDTSEIVEPDEINMQPSYPHSRHEIQDSNIENIRQSGSDIASQNPSLFKVPVIESLK